jgi:hypothetical protein
MLHVHEGQLICSVGIIIVATQLHVEYHPLLRFQGCVTQFRSLSVDPKHPIPSTFNTPHMRPPKKIRSKTKSEGLE